MQYLYIVFGLRKPNIADVFMTSIFVFDVLDNCQCWSVAVYDMVSALTWSLCYVVLPVDSE